MDFSGKKAIVTGGRRGIGRAIVEELAQRGADVLMADRQLEECRRFLKKFPQETGRLILADEVDVTSTEQARSMVDLALKEFGRIDILVNNAGVDPRHPDHAHGRRGLGHCTGHQSKRCLQLLKSCYPQHDEATLRPHCQYFIRLRFGWSGRADQLFSFKSGGDRLYQSPGARSGLTANHRQRRSAWICSHRSDRNDLPDELKETMIKLTPLGRWGTPEEIAYAVAFFASDQAAYITGQVLSVDGGMMMM